jgi:hypothetical protein
MSRYLVLVLALATAPLAACATQEAMATTPPAQRAQAAGDPQAVCVAMFQRARACTDTYIPALVDSRARHDLPAGIAAQVAADRDGVIAQAKTEWASDSKDDAIAAKCSASAAQATADELATVQGCLAKADCTAFTACIMPVFESRLAK